MMTVDPTLHLLMEQARGNISAQAWQVRRARTLREVVQHMDPTIPAFLRSVARSFPEARQLQAEAERRADELLLEQLQELEGLRGSALTDRLHELRTREWIFFRGKFPRQASHAEREAARLLRIEKERGMSSAA
ncbi:hypothetical protein F6X40_11470 [Paraburkholderia sp. UCT31]|uniref:hypothetical protein n=1 Tax=Paraburkholderia sp. UCT31 TaxID=2615209 RepID=UPI00165503E0|nr:hypothetical protein [Paraburkholderia sp. UCT31]MBC8737424.1 hypothetical protein [Paraburkholderia sp. UCT31]